MGGFSLGFLAVEMKRTFRLSTSVFFSVAFPIVMLVLVALPNKKYTINNTPLDQGGNSVAVPIMISLAVYGAMMASSLTGVGVAAERALGWSRQLRLTPLSPLVYILVKICCGLMFGAIAVILTLLVGAMIGITAPFGNLVAGGLIAWLASLSMTSLGLAIGYAFPAQNAMRFLGPILPILSFMGGLFTPLSLLPEAMQTAAKFTPVWGMADLAQSAAIGVAPDMWAIPNLVIWFVVSPGSPS